MFRIHQSETDAGQAASERVFLAGLLFALLMSLGCSYLTVEQFVRFGAAFTGLTGTTESVEALSLRAVNRLFLLGSLLMSLTLAICAGAFWNRHRCYMANQRSLRRVKMLAHDILASMDRGVVTSDREGIITSINSTAIGLLNVKSECVGLPLAMISPPGMPLNQVHQEVSHKQTVVRERDYNIDRAGRVLRLRLDGHLLKDDKGNWLGCVIHLTDVTERILMEDRMRRMERFIGLATLASGLHHEIKNPLTAMSIHIQLLEEGLSNGQSAESVDELVKVLKMELYRLNGVLESFRTFANLQKLTIQPTDTLEVVEDAVRLIRPQASEQGVQITLAHPKLPRVPLDADKFEQAVLNLLINALEAMPTGGQLRLDAKVAEGEFLLSIQDSGSGIPAEVRPRLFQPYFSTKEKGSGMGLALSEKLVSQHGGHINYRTGLDGTTFDITIPLEHRNGIT